jgi:tRNA dimethylallyltransferase
MANAEPVSTESAGTAPCPALIAIVGATGTGKSGLSLDLAEAIVAAGGAAEIVNADAMQLYRGMDIGTAKLPAAERRGIRHHLLDVLDVTTDASAAGYQQQARAAIDDIRQRGAVPILVGGSGLYVSSVIYDFAFPPRDEAVRARLEAELVEKGPGLLHARLREADPATAARIDPANGRRVVRALEVLELSAGHGSGGEGHRGHGGALPAEPVPWTVTRLIGLRAPRPVLTARLDARVEQMWREGLLEEVEGLIADGIERGTTASRAIGYAQALAELRGTSTREDAIAETQRLTRRYARRQVSWFKRYPDVAWFEHDDPQLAARALHTLAVDQRMETPDAAKTGRVRREVPDSPA